jgi:hypothetical protein
VNIAPPANGSYEVLESIEPRVDLAAEPPQLLHTTDLTPSQFSSTMAIDKTGGATSDPPKPSCREKFEIAIICSLQLEYDAVSLLFDRFWDENGDCYGRAVGDQNTYTTGRVGKYNVVLALSRAIPIYG